MKILMIDVGGSHVKVMNARDGELRKFKSGQELTGPEMVAGVTALTADWDYDVVSLGYPGVTRRGRPAHEPGNLGPGWLNLDYEKSLGHPVRIMNDAAMQALGNYTQGRMIFLGLGTGAGTCLIADDAVIPLEFAKMRLGGKFTLAERLAKESFKENPRTWREAVDDMLEFVRDAFGPDEIVLGGGNARHVDPPPAGCRIVENSSAYVGAERLWEGADLFATAQESTWKIIRRATP